MNLDLIRHFRANQCFLYREGSNHSIYVNLVNKKISSVPRHREVKNNLVRRFVAILKFQCRARSSDRMFFESKR